MAEPELTREDRERLFPIPLEIDPDNPDPDRRGYAQRVRFTEWAVGYDVLGQPIEDDDDEEA